MSLTSWTAKAREISSCSAVHDMIRLQPDGFADEIAAVMGRKLRRHSRSRKEAILREKRSRQTNCTAKMESDSLGPALRPQGLADALTAIAFRNSSRACRYRYKSSQIAGNVSSCSSKQWSRTVHTVRWPYVVHVNLSHWRFQSLLLRKRLRLAERVSESVVFQGQPCYPHRDLHCHEHPKS